MVGEGDEWTSGANTREKMSEECVSVSVFMHVCVYVRVRKQVYLDLFRCRRTAELYTTSTAHRVCAAVGAGRRFAPG